MDDPAKIVKIADVFSKATSLSLSRVSTLVFNDGKKLGQLCSGSDVTTRVRDRVLQWFSDNWPEGAEWPADVARPEPIKIDEAV